MKRIDMFKEYVGKLVFRYIVLAVVLGVYVFRPDYMENPGCMLCGQFL